MREPKRVWSVLDIPFDGYQRYAACAHLIGSMLRPQHGTRAWVLEVGSGVASPLARFLPAAEFEVFHVDRDMPQEYTRDRHYIQCDARSLPFPDRLFPISCCIDTLEHIPQEGRKTAIDELIRVTRGPILIACPCAEDEIAVHEDLANATYRGFLGQGHPRLDEHALDALPSATEVGRYASETHGLSCQIFPNGYLPRWALMIPFTLVLREQEQLRDYARAVNRFYNENLYPYDNKEPCYRRIVVLGYPEALSLPCRTEDDESRLHVEHLERLMQIGYQMLPTAGGAVRESVERELAAAREAEAAERMRAQGLERELDRVQAELSRVHERTSSLEATAREKSAEVRELRLILARIRRLAVMVARSERWRLGGLFVNLYNRIRRRVPTTDGVTKIQDLLTSVTTEDASGEENIGFGANRSARPTDHPPHSDAVRLISRPSTAPAAEGHAPARTVGARSGPTADIVVCVHNALSDVTLCLESVLKRTLVPHGLIIVNDGSDVETTEYLDVLCEQHPRVNLISNREARGYTVAANQGLRASDADYVVLLNSDTVVSTGWLQRLIECAESDPKAGIVGPLSNAASWQSVPAVFTEKGGWAVNTIPEGVDVEQYASMVSNLSERRFSEVPYINGFCMMIRRSVIDRIGYLDERNYPEGYCEENDYCLRAEDAGFTKRIADHAYVYHAKSKSFGTAGRNRLAREHYEIFAQTFGQERLDRNTALMKDGDPIGYLRAKLERAESGLSAAVTRARQRSPLKVAFLMPFSSVGGGVNSIVQEAHAMCQQGFHARVLVPQDALEFYREFFPREQAVFVGHESFEDADSLASKTADFDAIVATHWSSVQSLSDLIERRYSVLPAYYVQDYEPWFHREGGENHRAALASYTLIPGVAAFAKTHWLCRLVYDKHRVVLHKVEPSIDSEVFHPRSPAEVSKGDDHTVGIVAMVRTRSPRRSPQATFEALRMMKETYRERVDVRIFGCESDDATLLSYGENFGYRNYGVLTREDVAKLLTDSDIFIDLSEYQAFGRTGLEAMACGCTVVMTQRGGIYEYARHRWNCLLVDVAAQDEVLGAIGELVENPDLRTRLVGNGLLTAAGYSTHRAALSEYIFLQDAYRRRFLDFPLPVTSDRGALGLISIVILTHNNCELSKRCYQSVRANTEYWPYEIVVVDNYSTDDTRAWLRTIAGDPGVTVVLNDRNLQFAAGNNVGAGRAKGDWIVFLNNDTEVLPGWLSKMADPAAANSSIAAVGARLLRPGGEQIQHAGVELQLTLEGEFSRARALGVDRPSDDRDANTSRFVQAVTAACILVERRAFEEAGGFDHVFANGQEDVDLCLKLRQLGRLTYYEAGAEVIHVESAARGLDDTTLRNREIVAERWGDAPLY